MVPTEAALAVRARAVEAEGRAAGRPTRASRPFPGDVRVTEARTALDADVATGKASAREGDPLDTVPPAPADAGDWD